MHEVADEHTLESILSENDHIAEHNREHLNEMKIFGVNLMSAPGAGKTTLLAAAVPALGTEYCTVVEGDMVGEVDAERLRQKGIHAHQLNTGRSCHLDARMISRLLHETPTRPKTRFMFFENVGNLVCPAEFPLGEHLRVVLLSVTEGADKPLKYPVIFRNCDAVVFTKADLIPYVDFDLTSATQAVLNLNPEVKVFTLSTKTRHGLHEWLQWLREKQTEFSEQQENFERDHVHVNTR